MHEITQLIKSDPTFDQAFSCLVKYSRKQSLIAYIARKQDKALLMHELKKLERFAPKPKSSVIQKATKVIKPAKRAIPAAMRHERVERNALSPQMQLVYDENAQLYKNLRATHEKMKLANSDVGRAEFLSQIDSLNKTIKSNWKKIDNYLQSGKEPIIPSEDNKKIITTKKAYIGRMLKKEELSEEIIKNIKEAIKFINDNGASLSDKMVEEIKARGEMFV